MRKIDNVEESLERLERRCNMLESRCSEIEVLLTFSYFGIFCLGIAMVIV